MLYVNYKPKGMGIMLKKLLILPAIALCIGLAMPIENASAFDETVVTHEAFCDKVNEALLQCETGGTVELEGRGGPKGYCKLVGSKFKCLYPGEKGDKDTKTQVIEGLDCGENLRGKKVAYKGINTTIYVCNGTRWVEEK